jgi:hypothetical protein
MRPAIELYRLDRTFLAMWLAQKNGVPAGARVPKSCKRVWLIIFVVLLLACAWNPGFCWVLVAASSDGDENGQDGAVGEEEETGEEEGGGGYARDHGHEGGYHKSVYDLSERSGRLCEEHKDFLHFLYPSENMPDVRSIPNCTYPTENARGVYFSSNDCTFAYHKIDHPDKWSDFVLSTGCSDSNVITETLEDGTTRKSSFSMKVSPFPDQCVKNFRRCYSIEHDWKHYLAVVCKNYVSIPDEATHLSVDCRKDFINTLQNLDGAVMLDPYEKKETERVQFVAVRVEKMYRVITVGFAVFVSCAWVFYIMVVRQS